MKPKAGFTERVHYGEDGAESKYVVFVPRSYNPAVPHATILFLHGRSQTGTDNAKQLEIGLGPIVRARADAFDFLTIFPQAAAPRWATDATDGIRAIAILEDVGRVYAVDAHRVYLTGISMGGSGTWSHAAEHPTRWAAIVPICGVGAPAKAAALKDIPCWCFHGEKDSNVSAEHSRAMIAALRSAGGNPRYDELPGVGHNCWDAAYAREDLFAWLKQQSCVGHKHA